MQRKIGTEFEISNTVSPFDSHGKSSGIDRSVSNYTNAREKVQKIKQLISTGTYDTDIAKYILGMLDLVYQGMLEDIDTNEKAAHISYKNTVQLATITHKIFKTNSCFHVK